MSVSPASPAPLPWPALAAALLLMAAGLALGLADVPLNTQWFLGINGAPGPALQRLAAHLTLLGSGYAAILLMLAADRGQGIGPALALRTLLFGALLARAGKLGLAEPRPLAVLGHDAVQVVGAPLASYNTMPSGHTLTAFAGALALWFILRRCARSDDDGQSSGGAGWRLLLIALLALAAGVGWSRVVVGAHWPSDVLAGAGCGLLAALLAWAWECRQPWAPALARPWPQRVLALVEIALALTWLSLDHGQPGTQALQWAIGLVGLASGTLRLWRQRGVRQATARGGSTGP